MKPRLRFAPSPTGYLHIGGARTALFNWLYARRNGGVFVLRIEDTDQERSTPESVKAILDGLKWLGLDWDEGPEVGGPVGPYFQTQRLESYRKYADQLIAQGKAYRCYCTKSELDARRAAAKDPGWKYDGLCRDPKAAEALAQRALPPEDAANAAEVHARMESLNQGLQSSKHRPSVVRFKMPGGDGGLVFDDLVLGKITKTYSDLDDFVMARADGVPLYNFGCVIDDHEMEITLVSRGQEHINSTFPQLALYDGLGWKPPSFAHLPLILGVDREKLSKRKHPEADVMLHKANGVLPEALLNFVVRLGWGHGDDEYLPVEKLKELFDFKNVGKTSGVWNPEKLSWLNQQYLKQLPMEEIARRVAPFVPVPVDAADPKLVKLVGAFRERSKTLVEMGGKMAGYFKQGVTVEPEAAAKHLTADGKAVLAKARDALQGVATWNASSIDEAVKKLAETTGLKMGAIAQPLRVAVTGTTTSPGIGETLELVGRDEALSRIAASFEVIKRLARVWLRELGDEPTVIICGASALLLISHYQGSTGYFRNVVGNRFDNHPAFSVLSYWWWFFCAILLYLIMPLLLSYATRGSFNRKYGFGLGDWRAGLTVSVLFLVVMLPATYLASKWKAFAGAYPLAGNSAYTLSLGGGKTELSVGLFAIYELGYVLYFVGWEFFYRGWMLNGLLPRFGRAGAILIPVAPFAVMHMGKAEPEALGSIVAGVALGVLALRTRSFWYGVFVHASVAVWMDFLSASPVLFPKLWSSG